ncbi:MAG TPA: phosphate ABC transporter substrate-binding protein PstS [Devosiaceae bacterium]|jgi:phosphate transport system substrate-binding protein
MKTALFAGAAAAAFSLVLAGSALAADISGAGSTFIYPIFAKWADTYKTETGIGLNYQSIGSGGGITQVEAKTVTFGATDKPLGQDELTKNGLTQFPMIMGGIVPIVNIDGIDAGKLTLDGDTLAKIYMGKITSWDDAAIAALNPGVKLPSTPIVVAHRSDGSGTTFNFADYLSKVSPDWADQVGADTAIEWPIGVGAKGNEGVASTVKQTAGSIGYVEFAYAEQNKLAYANLKNQAGKVVTPTIAAFQAAASNADWTSAPGYAVIMTNQPGDASWPITATTWVLIHKAPDDAAAAGEALKFFDWAYSKGDDAATALDYIPMPDAVVDMIHKTWSTDVQADGKPVFAAK